MIAKFIISITIVTTHLNNEVKCTHVDCIN